MTEKEQLLACRAAILDYYDALNQRAHGGVAADRALVAIQTALDLKWKQGVDQRADPPPEPQGHYFAFSFKEMNDNHITDASVYIGYPDELVTLPRLAAAKEAAGVKQNAVLVSMSYLGMMTATEFRDHGGSTLERRSFLSRKEIDQIAGGVMDTAHYTLFMAKVDAALDNKEA